MKNHEPKAPPSEKFLVVPGLLLTTVLASGLLATRSDHWANSAAFVDFVISKRSSVGIIVQVISQLLGILHVYALCTTINLSCRKSLSHKSFTLDIIKLFNALSYNHFDSSLRWFYQIILLAFVIVTLLPAALWAGALTPVVAWKPALHQMGLPGWSNTTILEANYHSGLRDIYDLNTAKGLFTYRPDFDLQGAMLSTASSASSRSGGTNPHAKTDKTGYLYKERSFGIGASIGLMDDAFINSTQSYAYNEIGVQSKTSCIYNSTADLELGDDLLPEGGGWLYSIFQVGGTLPLGDPPTDVSVTAFAFNAGGIVSLFTASDNSSNVLGIVAGNATASYYGPLNNIQCDISFTPMNFSVSANTTNRTISVSSLNEVEWPSYGNLVTNRAIGALSTLASALTTVYVSILGQTLMYNIANVEAARGASNTSNLLGVADAVNSLIDDILVSYGSAQLMITKDSIMSEVAAREVAIVIGSPAYTISIFVLNLLICLIYLFEVIRTRAWRHLTRFNFMDIKTVIIGTSIGGTAIAEKVRTFYDAQGSVWSAKGSDRTAGNVRIRLDKSSQLVLADDGASALRQTPSPRPDMLKGSENEILLDDLGTERA